MWGSACTCLVPLSLVYRQLPCSIQAALHSRTQSFWYMSASRCMPALQLSCVWHSRAVELQRLLGSSEDGCAVAATPLHTPTCPAGNAASKEGIAPLLLARCNALLVQLSEYSSPSLIDSLVLQQSSKQRLLHFINTSCRLAQHYLKPAPFPADYKKPQQTQTPAEIQPLLHPDGRLNHAALNPAALAALHAEGSGLKPGESQLILSALRLLELAADDSGLREGAMEALAGVLGQALAAEPVTFAAR